MSKRCAFRGERKVMSGGRWATEPYRCEAPATEADPEVPGDQLCAKHAAVEARRRARWAAQDARRLEA